MIDNELRKFLGAKRVKSLSNKFVWDLGTRDNPYGELMEIRIMAFEALQKVNAIANYLKLSFEDGDLNKGNYLLAHKNYKRKRGEI